MPISFDPATNERNIAERGIPFDLVEEFEWDTALGLIEWRLYALVFTPRAGNVHVISQRKANPRETKRYEAQAQYQTKDPGES